MGKTNTKTELPALVAILSVGSRKVKGGAEKETTTPVAVVPADEANEICRAMNAHYKAVNPKANYRVGSADTFPIFADVDAFNENIVNAEKNVVKAKAADGKSLSLAELKMLGIDVSSLETDADADAESA